MSKVFVLFLPFLIGLLFSDSPRISITCSLLGSVFIAVLAQTQWFRHTKDEAPVRMRLLRPATSFHFYFLMYHVLGGAFHALDSAGYTFAGHVGVASERDLELIAYAQQLMLLAHASVTAGMKFGGFDHTRPRYANLRMPPYALIVLSLVTLISGTLMARVPALWNLSQKMLNISSIAIILELGFSIQRGHFANLVVTLLLFTTNLVQQMLSGWKGLVLWSVITLGALIYPIMPKRVLTVSAVFILFWVLYLHPFGKALRPLIWYQGFSTANAASISWDEAVHMSFEERLDNIWEMMVHRDNELYQFKMYIQFVPARRPYYGMEIVEESFVSVVPRFLWAGKPDLEALSMRRVYEAGIVSQYSTVSAKPSFYHDCYVSGGPVAIVIGCVVFGMIIIALSKLCEQLFGGYHIGTCLIYTSLFATAINFPPNFIFFVGTIASSLVTMVVLFAIGLVNHWIVHAGRNVSTNTMEGLPLSPEKKNLVIKTHTE